MDIPKSSGSVMDRPRQFDTLTTVPTWRANLCIRALIPVGIGLVDPVADQAAINAVVDDAISAVYGFNVEEFPSSYQDRFIYYRNGILYDLYPYFTYLRLAENAPGPQPHYPPLVATTLSTTTRRTCAGYGVIHTPRSSSGPFPFDILNTPWWVSVQRNLYLCTRKREYRTHTYSGYFHDGHAIYFGGADNVFQPETMTSDFPIEELSLVAQGPIKTMALGEVVEVPFPSPAVYGYPSVTNSDPYMIGHTSIYQATTGVINTIAPMVDLPGIQNGVDPSDV